MISLQVTALVYETTMYRMEITNWTNVDSILDVAETCCSTKILHNYLVFLYPEICQKIANFKYRYRTLAITKPSIHSIGMYRRFRFVLAVCLTSISVMTPYYAITGVIFFLYIFFAHKYAISNCYDRVHLFFARRLLIGLFLEHLWYFTLTNYFSSPELLDSWNYCQWT